MGIHRNAGADRALHAVKALLPARSAGLFCVMAAGLVMPGGHPSALGQIVPSGASTATAKSAPAATAPPSMLDQAAAPPAIEMIDGKLTIRATNSSLRAILDDLQARTGTQIQGLSHDERIFGVYGPGNPQEVLSSLLDDSGYNVLIAGRKADGSPREVVLSTRTAASSAPANTRTQAAEDDDETEAPEQAPPPTMQAPPITQPPETPGGAPQVKTPQQMLEELQRMRQGASGQTSGQTTPQ